MFIILDSFGQKCGAQRSSLDPIVSASQNGPLLTSVSAYYREDTDVALVALTFDERSMSDTKRKWLTEIAGDGGMAILDPHRLALKDREAFYQDYLKRYPKHIEGGDELGALLDELSACVGHFQVDVDFDADSVATQAPLKADVASEDRLSPHVGSRPARARKEKASDTVAPGPSRATNPLASTADVETSIIRVRFQIGEHWQLARLRSLTTKSAVLATGALPSHGRRARLEFQLDGYRSLASGIVESIDSSKTPSFRVHFDALSSSERQGIMELLLTATQKKIELVTPPARATPRFNVRWPVQVIVGNKLHRGLVSDISERGLFVATQSNLAAEAMKFHFEHDQIDSMITGQAKVVRTVDATMAKRIDALRGYGLELDNFEMAHSYQKFVSRVEKRNRYHLVVAAEETRAIEISDELQSCGYSVSTMTQEDSFDPVTTQQRIPDFAIVDPSFSQVDKTHRLESLLSEVQIPSLASTMNAEQRRLEIDRALSVL